MEINSKDLLNKASYTQLFALTILSLFFLITKNYSIFTALLISGVASFLYTQLISLGSYSKVFAIYGFPIRLLLIAPPTAILVHKSHSNLIALFIGFFICQIIYFIFVWRYAKKIVKYELGSKK